MAEFDKAKLLEWAKTYTNYEQLEIEGKAAFEGWSLRDPQNVFTHLKAVTTFLEKIVELVEKFSKDVAYLDNRTKLQAAVDFVDDIINLPWYLEWADNMAIQYILSTIVQQYNKFYGNNWLEAKNGTK